MKRIFNYHTNEEDLNKYDIFESGGEVVAIGVPFDLVDGIVDYLNSITNTVNTTQCNHYFVQKDTYWRSCIHCGQLSPMD